jgi:hypothetical protein
LSATCILLACRLPNRTFLPSRTAGPAVYRRGRSHPRGHLRGEVPRTRQRLSSPFHKSTHVSETGERRQRCRESTQVRVRGKDAHFRRLTSKSESRRLFTTNTTFGSVMLSPRRRTKHLGIIFRTDCAFKCGDSSPAGRDGRNTAARHRGDSTTRHSRGSGNPQESSRCTITRHSRPAMAGGIQHGQTVRRRRKADALHSLR